MEDWALTLDNATPVAYVRSNLKTEKLELMNVKYSYYSNHKYTPLKRADIVL